MTISIVTQWNYKKAAWHFAMLPFLTRICMHQLFWNMLPPRPAFRLIGPHLKYFLFVL